MNVTLSSSLHLDHGSLSLDQRPGDRPPMQAFIPMGLLCLKASAEKAGIPAKIRVTELNGLINQGRIPNDNSFYDHLVDSFFREGDDFAGLMTDADSLPHTVLLAEKIRQRSPRTKICLGGPASSPLSHLLLERFPFIDYVVRGEGDATFPELLLSLIHGRSLLGVAGLTWRNQSQIVINLDRPVIENLDEIPIPDLWCEGVTDGSSLYMDVGRGCPFRCRFCATAPFWNRRYRMKSIARILSEMRDARDRYGRRHVNFSHDIFTCDRKWTMRFCDALRTAELGMTWSCSTRTDIIDQEVLENLASAGCVEIYYGIETGSSQTQHFIEKDLDLNWSKEIVKTTARVGIRAVTGFIVGHPNETMQSLGDTLEKFFQFLELGKGRAHLFTLCPFHEAPMFRQYENSIDRPAEYADMALLEEPDSAFRELKRNHRDVFVSLYRYATSGVPARLVDASEEVSCHLVVLKSIWPLLLPHYDSALDWYTRWVEWVEQHNATYRPQSLLIHQGNAYDLLRFIDDELVRLKLTGTPLADLVRYEEAKLDARRLPPPALPQEPKHALAPLPNPTHSSILLRRCSYVTCKVAYDMSAVLSQRAAGQFPQQQEMWVIVTKIDSNHVDTMQTSNVGKRLLELADQPQSMGQLMSALGECGFDQQASSHLIGEFYRRGLLCEVKA